jgi:hypothetical protein
MKKTKRAFTTIELLVVMVVSMMLMSLLFVLLYHTTKLYNDTTTRAGEDGYALVMLTDMENLVRGCDYVSTDDEGRKLIVHYAHQDYVVDTNDYGLDAKILIDSDVQTISVYIGGEVYCIPYILNARL